jgi:hypothetical protein
MHATHSLRLIKVILSCQPICHPSTPPRPECTDPQRQPRQRHTDRLIRHTDRLITVWSSPQQPSQRSPGPTQADPAGQPYRHRSGPKSPKCRATHEVSRTPKPQGHQGREQPKRDPKQGRGPSSQAKGQDPRGTDTEGHPPSNWQAQPPSQALKPSSRGPVTTPTPTPLPGHPTATNHTAIWVTGAAQGKAQGKPGCDR